MCTSDFPHVNRDNQSICGKMQRGVPTAACAAQQANNSHDTSGRDTNAHQRCSPGGGVCVRFTDLRSEIERMMGTMGRGRAEAPDVADGAARLLPDAWRGTARLAELLPPMMRGGLLFASSARYGSVQRTTHHITSPNKRLHITPQTTGRRRTTESSDAKQSERSRALQTKAITCRQL